MKNNKLLSWLLIVVIIFSTMPVLSLQAQGDKKKDLDCINAKMVQLKVDMQKVWIDHTIWTSSYISNAINDLPSQKEVLNRLLQNQQDIGNLFKPYYGEEAGNKLTALLKEHIVIAGKIVAAAKAGNQEDVKKLEADWHKNADDIAKFLSELNPNWQFKLLQDMLYTHLQMITEIVVGSLSKDWKTVIETTDKNEIHMIHFADVLTDGIIKQFPGKF